MSDTMRSHYDTLGVSENADAETITKAFRALARTHHPDANPNDSTAEERFKEISAAYEVLSDDARRREYDRERQEGSFASWDEGAAPFSGGGGWSDLFSSVMGGFTGNAMAMRGDDVQADITVSFDDALTGTEREVSFRLGHSCPACGGDPRAMIGCRQCAQTGVVGSERRVKVTVPPGAREGTRVRLSGRGGNGIGGGPRGDLIVTIHLAPHPIFTRQGDDVLITAHVDMVAAALGTEINVPSPTGSRIRVRVPAGTQPGRILRVKDHGAPRLRGRGTGSLLVRIDVEVPTQLTDAERAALEAYRDASTP